MNDAVISETNSTGHGNDVEGGPAAADTSVPPRRAALVGRPFQRGVSGNPHGRPKIEPRVRKLARCYDRRMVRVLASIAEDTTVAPSERRKCACELVAIGSGRPALVQEIAGKDGAAFGPLVNMNFGMGGALTPEQAYAAMCAGAIPADGAHEAFGTAPDPALIAEQDAASPVEPEK